MPVKAELPHVNGPFCSGRPMPGMWPIKLICALPPFLMPILEPLINGKERLAAEKGRRPAFGGQRNKVALGNKPTMVRIVTEK